MIQHIVEDGIHMANLEGIPDIFGHGSTREEAIADLEEFLGSLVREMQQDFNQFSIERPNDIPYLLEWMNNRI